MNKRKLKVAILYGGQTCEHEVSILSARNVVNALDPMKYEIALIYISRDGHWFLSDQNHLFSSSEMRASISLDHPVAADAEGIIELRDKKKHPVDVVFPVFHGKYGEDGTIQGLLRLSNLPFVGSDVLGSAIGLDKEISKRLLREAGLPVVDFACFHHHQSISFDEMAQHFGSPFFVKPACSGSSIGISKVHDKDQWDEAVALAFRYDLKILIEKAIKGKELECAVLGNAFPKTSVVGEVIPHEDFYTYLIKYFDEGGLTVEIPAKISQKVSDEIRNLAMKAFQTLSLEGLARVDFFLDERENIFINEVNTIPGFTNMSPYPKLWEATGMPFNQIVDTLVELAIEKHQRLQRLSVDLPLKNEELCQVKSKV